MRPGSSAAIAANIPTVIIDDARTSGASSYIGTDQVKIGAQAATFLHDANPKGGKVAQIEGAAGSPNARARIKGFKEQLATYPDLQLVASQPGNWDRLTALNATSNILRQNPDLIGIYANNDGMALGVFEAVKNANAAGKTLVVGTDGIREAKKSVQAGEMSATVAEFPFEEGQLGVEVALRLLGCQPVPPWVVSPNAVITKDNVAKIPQSSTGELRAISMRGHVALSEGTSSLRAPMLAMRGVSKTFGRARVLNNVDLTLQVARSPRFSARTARANRR